MLQIELLEVQFNSRVNVYYELTNYGNANSMKISQPEYKGIKL